MPQSIANPFRVYVAGPMSGIADHNFPAFDEARDYLRLQAGCEVVSPADITRESGLPYTSDGVSTAGEWREFLRRDLRELVTCGRIVLLPGWAASRGACTELALAELLGLEVWYFFLDAEHGHRLQTRPHVRDCRTRVIPSLVYGPTHVGSATDQPKGDERESILLEADRLVSGDRQSAYGHPLDNFDVIGGFWTTYLLAIGFGRDGRELEAEDVALMMDLLKTCRLVTGSPDHRDSMVDKGGYAKCYALIRDERRRRAAGQGGEPEGKGPEIIVSDGNAGVA